MKKIYLPPMLKTASYMKRKGYSEKSIMEITGLSFLEMVLFESKEGLSLDKKNLKNPQETWRLPLGGVKVDVSDTVSDLQRMKDSFPRLQAIAEEPSETGE